MIRPNFDQSIRHTNHSHASLSPRITYRRCCLSSRHRSAILLLALLALQLVISFASITRTDRARQQEEQIMSRSMISPAETRGSGWHLRRSEKNSVLSPLLAANLPPRRRRSCAATDVNADAVDDVFFSFFVVLLIPSRCACSIAMGHGFSIVSRGVSGNLDPNRRRI
jgi:hypothetical protein